MSDRPGRDSGHRCTASAEPHHARVTGDGNDPRTRSTRRAAFRAVGTSTCGAGSAVRPKADRASLQASEAALASARLAAQAELATDYFELRAQDQLQIILDDIVAAEQQSLKITENRYRVGVAAKADVVNAQHSTAVQPGASR